MTWDQCHHEWREEIEHDHGDHMTPVICRKCQCPGMQDPKTGDVFWPAT